MGHSGSAQAAVAARLYGVVKRPRGRAIDLAVAESALHDGAALWTLNRADFRDLPDLTVL
jgi:predicted nucleic acid-binding protein